MMAAVLLAGIILFIVRFVNDGGKWATFYGNQSIYTNGQLNRGAVYDRNGVLLVKNGGGSVQYNDDPEIRAATVHAVGDLKGNISTAAMNVYKDKIIGYSLVTGTYSLSEKSSDIKLTLDADVCKTAYEALDGRRGTVGVYNYKTGEIICMVSTPGFDPLDPPEVSPDDDSGIYINRFLSATKVPGSIFKVLTSAAAIENLDNIDSFSYDCPGFKAIGGEKINCAYTHGHVDFEDALAKSCNGAYAEITESLGSNIMKEYVDKCGLTKSYNIDGVHNAKGHFDFPDDNPYNLAWAGIGQYKDEINPCSMMVFMGAIANGGKAAVPQLIHSSLPLATDTDRMLKSDTCKKLTTMMKHNVELTYGEDNYPDLDIYAKSGTAEEYKKESNAWFAGFIKNEGYPYAFIVCIENGGIGMNVAGPVANKVLQSAVNTDE